MEGEGEDWDSFIHIIHAPRCAQLAHHLALPALPQGLRRQRPQQLKPQASLCRAAPWFSRSMMAAAVWVWVMIMDGTPCTDQSEWASPVHLTPSRIPLALCRRHDRQSGQSCQLLMMLQLLPRLAQWRRLVPRRHPRCSRSPSRMCQDDLRSRVKINLCRSIVPESPPLRTSEFGTLRFGFQTCRLDSLTVGSVVYSVPWDREY